MLSRQQQWAHFIFKELSLKRHSSSQLPWTEATVTKKEELRQRSHITEAVFRDAPSSPMCFYLFPEGVTADPWPSASTTATHPCCWGTSGLQQEVKDKEILEKKFQQSSQPKWAQTESPWTSLQESKRSYCSPVSSSPIAHLPSQVLSDHKGISYNPVSSQPSSATSTSQLGISPQMPSSLRIALLTGLPLPLKSKDTLSHMPTGLIPATTCTNQQRAPNELLTPHSCHTISINPPPQVKQPVLEKARLVPR